MRISGDALRLLREIKRLNQKGIARKLAISQPAYCKLEQCKEISLEKTEKVIVALGYTKEEAKKIIDHLLPVNNFEKRVR
jgi:transcriptional regulator with XRE-family HTH domain